MTITLDPVDFCSAGRTGLVFSYVQCGLHNAKFMHVFDSNQSSREVNYSSSQLGCLRNRERARIYHHRPKIFHQSPPMPSQITILIILAIAPMVHQVRVST
jgi:hypothetical protein